MPRSALLEGCPHDHILDLARLQPGPLDGGGVAPMQRAAVDLVQEAPTRAETSAIQNEFRDLVTIPNLYLTTHPVTTTRSSGTIVSATVSLGYDVSRTKIEELLLVAAGNTGLQDPFVQILDLGDFSVTYRISGLLTNVKRLLSARTRLRAAMLTALHEAGVEIVSPTFRSLLRMAIQ